MRHGRSMGGFTLLELIVVLAVIGVVSSIGVSAFFNVTDAWRQSSHRMALGKTADDMLAYIEADIAQIASSRFTGQAVKGVDVLSDEIPFEGYRLHLEDDQIVLPLVQKGIDGKTERLAVRYHVERKDAPYALTRTLGPLDGTDPQGTDMVVGENVRVFGLQFEYMSGGTWHKDWSEPVNPDAVRVSLTVSRLEPGSSPDQISRSAIYPIHVK